MKILLYRWNAYNYKDVEDEFRRMGYGTTSFSYHLTNYDKNDDFQEMLDGKLSADHFDLVFTINFFPVVAEVCHAKKIPYVSWSCDSPLISMHHESVFFPENYIFDFDLSSCRLFEGMGVEHIWHLPLAVNVSRIDRLLAGAADLSSYENEIAFVGNLYERNSYDRLEKNLPEYLRGYFAATMEIQSNTYGGNVLEEALTPEILERLSAYFTLEKSEKSFSDLGVIFSTTVLGYKVARMQRFAALLELSKKHPVSLYTESPADELPGVFFRGGVDYWEELPKVFYGSRINLNLTIPNIKSGIPLRVWDVLGAGGFLLTNYQAESAMYFTEGRDLVSFYDREDMKEKADYYLRHEKERKQIAAHGRKTVFAEHTYEIRMRKMMDILKENQLLC